MKILSFIFLSLISFSALADDAIKEVIDAKRSSGAPKIDGSLNDDFWQNTQPVFDGYFTEFEPNNGETSELRTTLYLAYTDESIFVAAKLYDDPDKVLRELGRRDDDRRNTDIFGVGLDTYKNGRNAFFFQVTAAGVQIDSYISPNDEDRNWNAVWKSDVEFVEDGWIVEMEIPYYAIRFPEKDVQDWGVNFMRKIRRKREESYWNSVDNSIEGYVNQFGEIRGLKDINPPVRLQFTPYLSSYVNYDGVNNNTTSSFTGGMDVKYGINESFTMDMSLIPDFGQVRSDNIVYNLSAFEVRYDENRDFFTEGTELFGKGGLFYSRRIGQAFGRVTGEMNDSEQIIGRPSDAPLLNAVKVSGRTRGGLGIGVFNAITNKNYVTVENTETGEVRTVEGDPLTNFNIVVLDQNLKNNSTVSFINTNVTRAGKARNANVTGGLFQLNDKSNTYRVSGSVFGSQIFDYNYDILRYQPDIGYKYFLSAGKISGKIQFNVSRNVESDNYNINDLGFIRAPNEITHRGRISYNIFRPFSVFNRMRFRLEGTHRSWFEPRTFNQFRTEADFFALFRNFWHIGINAGIRPVNEYDYIEPRVTGRYVINPSSVNGRISMSSDSRKMLSFWGTIGGWKSEEYNQSGWFLRFSPRLRLSDRLNIQYSARIDQNVHSRGYVTRLYDDFDKLTNIIFGDRNVKTTTNTLNINYTFNEMMSLTFRARHYWRNVGYNQYFDLSDDGRFLETTYTGVDELGFSKHDASFNAFNIDMVYSWQFAPGSFLNIVWKQSTVADYGAAFPNYWENLNNSITEAGLSSISARVIYWIDYQSVRKLFKGKS